VKAGPVAQRREVAARTKHLAAGLLDQRERLRARHQTQPVASQVGADEEGGERSHGLDAEVHPGVALARQALGERVTHEQRRRDEDLLRERGAAAGVRESGEKRRPDGSVSNRLARGSAAGSAGSSKEGRLKCPVIDSVLTQSADKP
jgi:hypothetical protein